MIENKLTLKIWEAEFVISFPLTWQFLEINCLRAKLTKSEYENLKFLESEGLIASLVADTIAHFAVMLPTINKENKTGRNIFWDAPENQHVFLNVKYLLDLPVGKLIELCWIYNDIYFPWYQSILNSVSAKSTNKPEENQAAA